jgi:hypothetical protein
MQYSIELLQFELGRKRRELDLIDEESPISELLASEIKDLEDAIKKLNE